MNHIKIEFTNERIVPASGLSVVGAILGKSDFVKALQPDGCDTEQVTKQYIPEVTGNRSPIP